MVEAIREGLSSAFASITSLNPLPVADVSRSNFFATAPRAIFYQEKVSRVELNVNVSGTDDPQKFLQALGTPEGQRIVTKAAGFEGQKVNYNLGFQGA